MKWTYYSGWLMVVVGVISAVGGTAALGPLFGAVMLLGLAGSGAFMIWLSAGWDKPLDDAQDLYKYGRPANATVTAVADEQVRPDGVRTAKLSLHVTPLNESEFNTTRVLALPGDTPAVGERVTVKFDPNSRKNVVLERESYEVEDGLAQARRAMQATLPTTPTTRPT